MEVLHKLAWLVRLVLGGDPRKLGRPKTAEDATAAQIRLLAALPST